MQTSHETLDLRPPVHATATRPRASGRIAPPPGLEQFELRGELGRGGMGVVFRAYDVEARREVALKVLSKLTGIRRKRFRREGEVAARLDHPGVLKIHASGVAGGSPYLVYELVEGCRTLDVELAALDLPERIERIVEVAEVLGHAHAHGVVHRDVKPQNVLIGDDGRLRVADFGLAFVADEARLTRTGASLGTPHAMAPEQVRGDRESIGPPTDVWALGVLLYYALTDAVPFDAESVVTLASQILTEDPPPPSTLNPNVPPGIDRVCQRALRRDPRERYADGAAFARALRAPESEATLRHASPRWRRAIGLGLPLLAALALTLGAVIYEPTTEAATVTAPVREAPALDPSPPPPEAPARVATAPAEPIDPSPDDGITDWLKDPTSARAILARAQVRASTGSQREALADYAQVIGLEPDVAQHFYERARLRSSLGDRRGAVADMEEAVRLQPSVHHRATLVGCYLANSEHDAALRLAEALLRDAEGPSRGAALHAYGRVQLRRGQFVTAEQFLEAARRIPDWKPSHELDHDRAQVYARLGRFDDALEALTDLVQRAPDLASARAARADLLIRLGQRELAIEDFSHALRILPRNSELLMRRAYAHVHLRQLDRAMADAQAVVEAHPDLPGSWGLRGIIEGAYQRWSASLADLNHAVELAPDNPLYRVERARALAKLGRNEEARADALRALEIAPSYRLTHKHLLELLASK